MARINNKAPSLLVIYLFLITMFSNSYADDNGVNDYWYYDLNRSLQSDDFSPYRETHYHLPSVFKPYMGGCLAYYKHTGLFYKHGRVYARTYLRGPNAHYPACKKLDFQYFQDIE